MEESRAIEMIKRIPTIIANRIICNIFPSAKPCIGFLGIIFSNVSVNGVDSAIVVSACSIDDISRPIPGLITFATDKATVIARAVVTK